MGGDVIDLVGYLNVPGYDPYDGEHVKRAISTLSGTHEINIVREPSPQVPLSMSEVLPLDDQTVRYAKERGVKRSTLELFRCGRRGSFMAIPSFEYGELKSIKLRNMGEGHRYRAVPGSSAALFGHDEIMFTEEPLLIVKGEIAAMVMHSLGITNVCAPASGEAKTKPEWYGIMHSAPKRVVVGDNDAPEVAQATIRQARQRAKVLDAELHFPPQEFKDIDDWALQDPSALEEIRSWLK